MHEVQIYALNNMTEDVCKRNFGHLHMARNRNVYAILQIQLYIYSLYITLLTSRRCEGW